MELSKAKPIVKAYRETLERGTEGETKLRRASWLSHSKGMIKHAYFTMIEEAIRQEGKANEEVYKMADEYSMLNSFVDDNQADKYSKIYTDWQTKKTDLTREKKDERKIKQYIYYTHSLRDPELINEINDFIKDLLQK